MTTLKFVDTHNMVAFLAKPAESEGFEKMVDFHNAYTIKYALTVNPTIYTSCIEQFWATVKAKTVNGEVQLQALVDGKKIIITESIIRRDLQLEDAKDVDCLPNATILEQLTLMSAKTTAWNEFSSTMASAIICLATNQKFNFSKYIFASMVKNLDNVSGIFLMYPRLGKDFSRRDTPLFPTMMVQAQAEMGEDEAINEKMDDSLATPNEAGSQGTTSSGGPRHQDTMRDTIAQTRVLDLENTKIAQAQEITSLKLRVKKLEKKRGTRTHKLKILYKVGRPARVISSDEASLGDQEDASKQGKKIDGIDKDAEITLVDETQGRYCDDLIFDTSVLDDEEVCTGHDMAEKEINMAKKEVSTADPVTTAGEVVTTANVKISTASPTKTIIADDLTLAQTLIEIRNKGKATMEEPEKPTKRKGQIRHDEEVAQRLQAQLQAELEEEDRLVRQREEEANIVSWDNVQAMIDADYQMA
ncbi:hypothetical protein Tco_0660353 [Tanacetum coccineum]